MLLQLDFMLAVCYGGYDTISYFGTVDSNIQAQITSGWPQAQITIRLFLWIAYWSLDLLSVQMFCNSLPSLWENERMPKWFLFKEVLKDFWLEIYHAGFNNNSSYLLVEIQYYSHQSRVAYGIEKLHFAKKLCFIIYFWFKIKYRCQPLSELRLGWHYNLSFKYCYLKQIYLWKRLK